MTKSILFQYMRKRRHMPTLPIWSHIIGMINIPASNSESCKESITWRCLTENIVNDDMKIRLIHKYTLTTLVIALTHGLVCMIVEKQSVTFDNQPITCITIAYNAALHSLKIKVIDEMFRTFFFFGD